MADFNKKELTVGVVIADIDEYVHIAPLMGDTAVSDDIYRLTAHTAVINGATKTVNVKTICSGIGKVSATVAATLIAKDCDILINAGLSGGFGDAKKYDIVLGTSFIEHDFDLTAIGYKLSQKPGQTERLKSDAVLNNDVLKKFPFIKSGVFVTGDSFISSAEKHDLLKEAFNPIACDMESAAVAAVAERFNIPFLSIRMISDGADDESATIYTDTLKCDRADSWLKVTFDWIKSL